MKIIPIHYNKGNSNRIINEARLRPMSMSEARMYNRKSRQWLLLAVLLAGFICFTGIATSGWSQDEWMELSHGEVFSPQTRPPVSFPHHLHVVSLEKQGCGACHHDLDSSTDELVYMEGEEQGCTNCHSADEDDDTPALREAFHQSCTSCHRSRIKRREMPSGFTTCGECHQP
ncbi:cytochrome c3 family protein [Desulfobacterales bacterium HSG17]|nr:cytochrome c3 family protein [Desulfobacterales bacterium HSG17]